MGRTRSAYPPDGVSGADGTRFARIALAGCGIGPGVRAARTRPASSNLSRERRKLAGFTPTTPATTGSSIHSTCTAGLCMRKRSVDSGCVTRSEGVTFNTWQRDYHDGALALAVIVPVSHRHASSRVGRRRIRRDPGRRDPVRFLPPPADHRRRSRPRRTRRVGFSEVPCSDVPRRLHGREHMGRAGRAVFHASRCSPTCAVSNGACEGMSQGFRRGARV